MFKYSFISVLAFTLITASSFAQAQSPNRGNGVHVKPQPGHGSYSLATGFSLAPPRNYSLGSNIIFDNTSGDEVFFSPIPFGQEWVDEFALPQQSISGEQQISRMTWEYCSTTPDVGGLGVVDVEVRFYEDTVPGVGPTGWEDLGAGTIQNAQCTYQMYGLPGDLTPGGPEQCWVMTLDMDCGFDCTVPEESTPGGFTEKVGIGWMYNDGGSGPKLTSLLPAGTVPGYGSVDYFELFDLAVVGAEYQGSFLFGGAPDQQASFSTTLYGLTDPESIYAIPPRSCDTLTLSADTPLRAGCTTTYTVGGWTPGSQVFIAFNDNLFNKPFGVNNCATSLLGQVSVGPYLVTGGVYSFTPAGPLPKLVYVQAFEIPFMEPIMTRNVVAASNGILHRN